MTFHVLNGDALKDRFVASKIPGEILIMREALITGPVQSTSSNELFRVRSKYFDVDKSFSDYGTYVQSEIERLKIAGKQSQIVLWFGHDLFCQANLWFLLHYLDEINCESSIAIAYPAHLTVEQRWEDFGNATPSNLELSFSKRIILSNEDVRIGSELWMAYREDDLNLLRRLSAYASEAFPHLEEVVKAHIDRFPPIERPIKKIAELKRSGISDFSKLFHEFQKTEMIYGFGDMQVLDLMRRVDSN